MSLVTSDPSPREIVASAPRLDTVGVQERAASLAKRSIKKDAKRQASDPGWPGSGMV